MTSKGQNIQVLHSGNYTLTLKTYPHEDFYNTDDPSYSDDQKEVYNFGLFDRIEWVRNGDPVDPPTVVVDYYIKGANITGWQDMLYSDRLPGAGRGVHVCLHEYDRQRDFERYGFRSGVCAG